MLDTNWEQVFRPELLWHTFRPVPVRDPASEAIHVFSRVTPPIIPRRSHAGMQHRQGSRISAISRHPPEEGLDSPTAVSPRTGVGAPVDLVAAYAHKNFGAVLYTQGKYEAAAAHFTEALRLNPGYADAHNNLGTILFHQGRYTEAEAHFAEAVRLEPGNVQAHHNLGLVLSGCGNYEAATAQFALAIRLEPDDPSVYNASAMLMAACPEAKFRDGQAAVEFATRACELTEWKDPLSLNSLAAAQAEAGDFDAAVSSQKKAIELLKDQGQKDDYGSRLASTRPKNPTVSPDRPPRLKHADDTGHDPGGLIITLRSSHLCPVWLPPQ